MKTILLACLAAALLPAAAGADVFPESGDAGQTIATAANTAPLATGQPLTAITGSLGAGDADLFRIYVADFRAFSASTNNAVTNNGYALGGELDTALFLFDSAGHAIATNDDANGLFVTSTLPVGNTLYANLAAGYYYLGVSVSGNEPVNSANNLLFLGYPAGNTAAVRGAATAINPTIEANFDNGPNTDQTPGVYRIDLTGVTVGAPSVTTAVPEPASWMLAIGGLGLAGGALRRRTRPARRFAAA